MAREVKLHSPLRNEEAIHKLLSLPLVGAASRNSKSWNWINSLTNQPPSMLHLFLPTLAASIAPRSLPTRPFVLFAWITAFISDLLKPFFSLFWSIQFVSELWQRTKPYPPDSRIAQHFEGLFIIYKVVRNNYIYPPRVLHYRFCLKKR